MASLIASYKFTVQLELLLKNKSYPIPSSSVKSIMINYDYDKNNMPVLYLNVRLSGTIYNKMVLNADTATLSFRLYKFDELGNSIINEPYIEDNFTYVMSSDPNYDETLEQVVSGKAMADNDNADSYLEGYISILSLRLINDNKKFINDIVKDTDPLSIIHKYTSHMPMCIEPLDSTVHIDQFIIPPITSITNLIQYINNNYCLYKSGYRFFRDFAATYLLSMKGKPVNTANNNFNTIIISIRDPMDRLSKVSSMEIDRKNHAYIIYVNAKDTSIKIDRTTNKQYNSILGVDTLGNTIKEELKIPDTPDISEKVIIERVQNDNLEKIYNSKATIESLSVILTIAKNEIDSTLLTPNKEYQVRNYSGSRDFDGRYVLSYKKEIMYQQDKNFIDSVMFGLRRVTEE